MANTVLDERGSHLRKGKWIKIDVTATLKSYVIECLKILNDSNILFRETYHKAFEKLARKHQQTLGGTRKKVYKSDRRRPIDTPINVLRLEPHQILSISTHYNSLLNIFNVEWLKLKARKYQDETPEAILKLFRENTRQRLLDYAAKHGIQIAEDEVPLEQI